MAEKSGQPKGGNRSRVFETLRSGRLISRANLARQTGLSRATISILADDLLRVGVAEETGLGDSTGGRPPVLLQFNPDAALALGARMRDREWGIVLTNLDAGVKHHTAAPIEGNTPDAAVAALQAGVKQILAEVDPASVLPAIGLGTPGLVDTRSGVIKSAVDVGWNDVPIREMAERALGRQTFVANRSKVGALAELWCDLDYDVDEIIYIAIGTGIAAGIVHEGRLFVGANSSAGELGHVTVLPDGPLCLCGNRGCLQQLASGPAIANRAREQLRRHRDSFMWDMVGHHPEQVTAQTVFKAAERGDEMACTIVAEIAGYLGIAVANLVNLFNPELIVLGGPVGQAVGILLEPLHQEVRRRAMAYPLSAARIVTSTLGPDAGAIGAAVLVLQQASELIFTE